MTSKHAALITAIGVALGGVAALVNAFVGDAGVFDTKGEIGESRADGEYVRQQNDRNESAQPMDKLAKGNASQLDAQVARTEMSVARKAALSQKCDTARPGAFARGEITFGQADDHLSANSYDRAIARYMEAAEHYRDCSQD